MNSYCAFLGHQPAISLAELEAVIPDLLVQNTFDNGNIITFTSQYELDQNTIDRLGGTIYLGKRFSSNTLELRDVPNLLATAIESCKRGKVTFSIRSHGISKKDVLNLYRDCKDYLRKAGRSSRYMGSEKKTAPAAALHDQEIISGAKGAEIIVLRTKQDTDMVLWIGQTIAAQNVNEYTKRDIEKPVRDTNIGLLPPKLAQILLNFGLFAVQNKPGTQPPKREGTDVKVPKLTVYDPFCGTGVVLLEALLMGWNVIGSDNSAKAVKDSNANVAWLTEQYKLKKTQTHEVFKHDATKPFEPKLKPDVIVTETSLGPNLLKRPNVTDSKTYCKEAEALEAAFLKNAKEVYPTTPIVCILPVWYSTKEPLMLEKIWNAINELGYDAILPSESATDQQTSLLYRRPNQFVGRQIVILVPRTNG